ncbi:hypothetical protein J6590_010389 [Homalodisca vitripennis]|nr:hypothetical protein J6590_010389 [Homalodisca vitripennis]
MYCRLALFAYVTDGNILPPGPERVKHWDESRVSSSPGPAPLTANSPRGAQFDLEDDAFPPLPASAPAPPPAPLEPPPDTAQPTSASQSHRENRSVCGD